MSMEHSLQNIKEGNYGEFVRWGIIIILPIYALAQPPPCNSRHGVPKNFYKCLNLIPVNPLTLPGPD